MWSRNDLSASLQYSPAAASASASAPLPRLAVALLAASLAIFPSDPGLWLRFFDVRCNGQFSASFCTSARGCRDTSAGAPGQMARTGNTRIRVLRLEFAQ